MNNVAGTDGLSRQDRLILASAEFMLRPDRPDDFDFATLSARCGVAREKVRQAFPFPELLTVGIVAMGWGKDQQAMAWYTAGPGPWWTQVLEICRVHGQSWLRRPNSFRLTASGWEPDPALLAKFSAHPAVLAYGRQESSLMPLLRGVWPRSGAVCKPDFLAATLHDRLNMLVCNAAVTTGVWTPKAWQAWAHEMLADYLAGIGEILGETEKNTGRQVGQTRRIPDA